MKINEAILNRRSVRKFTDDLSPQEDLIKIVEAARWAPTAANRQKTRFVVVTDEELLQKIVNNAKIVFYKQKHASQAKAMIVVCLDSTTWVSETGAQIQNILLVAYSLGIGSCWIGAFKHEKVRKILKIPQNYELIALILLLNTVGFARSPDMKHTQDVAYLLFSFIPRISLSKFVFCVPDFTSLFIH
ncbi:MAG: nitroreductase family protein [Promethearchaeota archaeon]